MPGSKLVQMMQESAKQAMNNGADMLFGEVTSTKPLKIRVENRFELTEKFLVLTSMVQDFETEITINWDTETQSAHTHEMKGKKIMRVHLALKKGERVILMRVQGGQKFIVIDRIR